MRWAGHMACMGERRGTCKILWVNRKETGPFKTKVEMGECENWSSRQRMIGHRQDWSGSGYEQVAGSCVNSNKASSSIICGEFLDWLKNNSFSRRILLHGVNYIFILILFHVGMNIYILHIHWYGFIRYQQV